MHAPKLHITNDFVIVPQFYYKIIDHEAQNTDLLRIFVAMPFSLPKEKKIPILSIVCQIWPPENASSTPRYLNS